MKPISNVKRLLQEADDSKVEVCRLLEWTELEYCNFQYECGLLYLSIYLNNDQWGVNLIHRCRAFWTWWKNHWVIRDKTFFVYMEDPEVDGCFVLATRQHFYRLLHDAKELARDIHPNGTVLQDTYAEMMGQIIDQTTS